MEPTAPSQPLLSRGALVVHQRAKLFELRNEYAVTDEAGSRIGAVAQVRQSPLTVVARLFSDLDVALPVTLEVREADGAVALTLAKPWFRMAVTVTAADGAPLGQVRKQLRLGKARFALVDATGTQVGEVVAENWRAKDFAVRDRDGAEVARVTKKWRGMARELFTDADTYVVQLSPGAAEPLRSLAFASALSVDLVMKQKDTS